MHKIFIIGNSGSGTSYLAKKLSNKYNIPHFDLDDIFWEKKFTVKRIEDDNKKLLSDIIQNNKSWIIEGIFTSFVSKAILNSDKIIWLDTNINIVTFRIIKRDIFKVVIGENSLKNLLDLINYTFLKLE